jgi:hypothetical protein
MITEILPANSAASGGFEVANSVRLDTNAYMHKTPSGSGNRKTWTASVWVKGQPTTTTNNIAGQAIYSAGNAATDRTHFYFTNGIFEFRTEISNTQQLITTNQVFTDPAAWYHIVVAVDSTQSTDTNRVKIYANGVQITSFSAAAYLAEDADTSVNHTVKQYVGSSSWSAGSYFNGYMAEFVLLDGTAATPTSFGEFDEDSNIWKPIRVSGLTFGTNGFYLDFKTSDNLGNDANGGTDLTEVNIAATDQTTDTCTNNFATLNPLSAGVGDVARIPTFSEGNTKFTAAGANTFYQAISTFGAAIGKWYFEVKVASDQDLDKLRVGYWNIDKNVSSGEIQDVSAANSGVFYMNKDGGEMRLNATSTTADYGTFGDNELMGVAIDMDAQTITILKANSVIVNAYDYSGGIAAGTVLTPAFMGYDDTAFQVNYGNPHEANTSDEADGNGYGAFEFAPPSGYLSWCSANLSEVLS